MRFFSIELERNFDESNSIWRLFPTKTTRLTANLTLPLFQSSLSPKNQCCLKLSDSKLDVAWMNYVKLVDLCLAHDLLRLKRAMLTFFFCISSVILALTENFVFCFALSILTQITEIPRFSVVLSIRLQVIENDDCDSIKFNMTIEESATKLCRSFTRRTNLLWDGEVLSCNKEYKEF